MYEVKPAPKAPGVQSMRLDQDAKNSGRRSGSVTSLAYFARDSLRRGRNAEVGWVRSVPLTISRSRPAANEAQKGLATQYGN
jgi:hypothetical protein